MTSTPTTPPPTVTNVNPNNGPQAGGNTVTVTGSGFVSGSTTVDFGSTAGTAVSVSNATSLTVVVPAGTGTVSVTVITTGGGSSTPLAGAYTYNVPAPTVTAVSPDLGTDRRWHVRDHHRHQPERGHRGPLRRQRGHRRDRQQRHVGHGHVTFGTGTVDVTVTTPGGTSAANPPGDQFTYNAAAPTVTAVSPNNGPEAGGTSVTITGTNLSGATAVHFGANRPPA